jgi:opacity protein-like surface antigen
MSGKALKSLAVAAMLLSACDTVYAVGEGMYLGIQGGTSKSDYSPQLVYGTSTVLGTPNNNQPAARILFGYQMNPYPILDAALEFGYTYFDAIDYDTESDVTSSQPSIRQQAIDIVGKGILQSTLGVGIYGKAGLAVVYAKKSGSLIVEESDGVSSNTSSSTTIRALPTFGAGISYDITQSVVVDISATRLLGSGGIKSIDFYALGFTYHFVEKRCGQFTC